MNPDPFPPTCKADVTKMNKIMTKVKTLMQTEKGAGLG